MGGYGSGRTFWHTPHDLTSDLLILDIRKIKRTGCLTPGFTHSWQWTWSRSDRKCSIQFSVKEDRLHLNYRHRGRGEEWESLAYDAFITRTPCHLGGERVWFVCPGKNCGKRVAILYGGKYFLCRECSGAVYASQRETDLDRHIRRIDKLRDRLKWEPGFLNGMEWKPKGMHWRTFWKLHREYESLQQSAFRTINQRFNMGL